MPTARPATRPRPATWMRPTSTARRAFTVQTGVAKTYGTFSIDAAGAWSYTLDDNNAAVQALNTGGTLHELVTVTTADGTDPGDRHHDQRRQRRGGDHRRRDGLGDRGDRRCQRHARRRRPRPATWMRPTSTTRPPSYVQAGVGQDLRHLLDRCGGAWSYTLDDNNAAVQALNTGGTLHELVTVTTADGTDAADRRSRSTAPTTRR